MYIENMNKIWSKSPLPGNPAQWLVWGIVAVVVGFIIFILATVGLLVGAVLVALLSLGIGFSSKRRQRKSSAYFYRVNPQVPPEAEKDCVDMDRDQYTVRVIDEKKQMPDSRLSQRN